MPVSMTRHFQSILGSQESFILYLLRRHLIRLAQYAIPHFDSAITQLKITEEDDLKGHLSSSRHRHAYLIQNYKISPPQLTICVIEHCFDIMKWFALYGLVLYYSLDVD